MLLKKAIAVALTKRIWLVINVQQHDEKKSAERLARAA
jgi:hypothetical protein